MNASNFCIETQKINASDQFSDVYCPVWAGGKGKSETRPGNTGDIACHANPHCKASPDCRKDPLCAVMRGRRFHNDTCAAAGFDATTCKGWKQTDGQFQYGQAVSVHAVSRAACLVCLTVFCVAWQWINLPVMAVGSTPGTITADISQLGGQVPTAVKYAWGSTNCCDLSDPTLGMTHGCVANCPIMGSSSLPANPFIAKITGGKCGCVAPQVCGA